MLPYAMNGKWHQVVLAWLGCCLLFVANQRCEAQNLVPNPSFELLEDSCPNGCCFNPGFRPLHWYTWQNSVDYFNACAVSDWPDSLVDVPQNGMTYQYASDGQAYVGLYTYQPTLQYREYVGVELVEPMIPGCTYSVSFRLNLAWDGNYWGGSDGGCNNVGALFTVASNAWQGITGPAFGFRNYAHVYSVAILTDTADWTLVSGIFTADSAYQHMVLGNFFDNSNTDVEHIPSPGTVNAVYVLVDDVSVTIMGQGCEMSAITEMDPMAMTSTWNGWTEQVVVNWPGASDFTVEVFDGIGKRVFGPVKTQGEQISIGGDDLATACYTVRVFDGKRKGSTKFVVTR